VSFSYSGDPSSSARDAVRFSIGDTADVGHVFEDAEIDYLLSGQPDVTLVSIDLCKKAIAHFAQLCTMSAGATSVQYRERGDNYRALQAELRKQLSPAPYAGGISIADKSGQDMDNDWSKTIFRRDMDKRAG
jgi:hypothetical protein